MHASSFLAVLGAAGIASALPQGYTPQEPTPQEPTSFSVNSFRFGFTSSIGYYSGNFAVPGYADWVVCKGASNVRDWQPCEAPGNGLSTYLSQNETTQQYTLNTIYAGADSTFYFGKQDVYSETGVDGAKAQQNYTILVTGKAQTA